MVKFDVNDIAASEVDLSKYISDEMVWKFIPQAVKRSVDLLVEQWTHKIVGRKLIKLG